MSDYPKHYAASPYWSTPTCDCYLSASEVASKQLIRQLSPNLRLALRGRRLSSDAVRCWISYERSYRKGRRW